MNIVQGGDLAVDALIYPAMNSAGTNYILNQFSSLSQSLTDIGRTFMGNAYEVFQKINNSEAMSIANNALRRAGEILYMDVIKPLVTASEICQAPVIMQRYIMACPDIRKEYQYNRLSGYSETYFDRDPGVIGEKHYDYRRVMDGVLHEDKDGLYKSTEYYEDLFEDDRELTHREKADILTTWDIAKKVLEMYKEDITDPYNHESFNNY